MGRLLVVTLILAAVLAASLAVPALAEPLQPAKTTSLISDAQIGLWRCQEQLGVAKTYPSTSPWRLKKNETYRQNILRYWKDQRAGCSKALVEKAKALKEKARQWNWQAFPNWVISLARCESSLNWYAEGSSSDGTFYSAFNIGRSRYDEVAHKMGVRGWREGPGVPSPYEQAMAVIGYVRTYGDGFTGSCHGIARSSWD